MQLSNHQQNQKNENNKILHSRFSMNEGFLYVYSYIVIKSE